MTANFTRLRAILAGAGLAALLLVPMAVRSDDAVLIYVNGAQMQFDQPPIERAGRVFVPLRGVFERLGASVVYDNGMINATGNGRDIQLSIGSTTALVNGNLQTLDVAPFIVGARTLVPLRFISQSLGAIVSYDDASKSVMISMSNQPVQTVGLIRLRPSPDGVVQSSRPAVSGAFSVPVDPNSIRITLDGRDVSSTTYVSRTDFLFTPPYDLTPQRHVVEVVGKSANGVPFDRSWSFASGISSAANFLNSLSPQDGTLVGGAFTVAGTTLPNARVRIAATTAANLYDGTFRAVLGTYTADVQADSYGRFAQPVNVQTVNGGYVVVRLTSVDPATNAGASATLNLRTQG